MVFGPGRTRLDPDSTGLGDPATDEEVHRSYQRARALLIERGDYALPLLLSKPLNGFEHGGRDRWGNNVYADSDPGYVMLRNWAAGDDETDVFDETGGEEE